MKSHQAIGYSRLLRHPPEKKQNDFEENDYSKECNPDGK